MSKQNSIRVWDIPTRVFHWSLVICVAISIYTGINGGFTEMDYHMLSGYTILGLVSFRIIWGLIGSHHARFSDFIRPRELISYSRDLLNRDSTPSVGHNPLGGLSVLALLLVLAIQAGTGLFADDDIMLEGPLTHLVSDETGDLLTSIHHLNIWAIYGLVGLHIFAVLFYEIYKRQRLIVAMITGRKKLSAHGATARPVVEILLGMITGLLVAGGVYWLVTAL